MFILLLIAQYTKYARYVPDMFVINVIRSTTTTMALYPGVIALLLATVVVAL